MPIARRRPAVALRRGVVVLALVLLVAGCGGDGPIRVETASLSANDAARCQRLLDRLPTTMAGLTTHAISPTDAPAHAWGDGLLLTCGVSQPADFNALARCDEINHVGWYFPATEYSDEHSDLTATAVGFRPRVSLLVPAKYRGNVSLAALTTLAGPIRHTLRNVQPCQ